MRLQTLLLLLGPLTVSAIPAEHVARAPMSIDQLSGTSAALLDSIMNLLKILHSVGGIPTPTSTRPTGAVSVVPGLTTPEVSLATSIALDPSRFITSLTANARLATAGIDTLPSTSIHVGTESLSTGVTSTIFSTLTLVPTITAVHIRDAQPLPDLKAITNEPVTNLKRRVADLLKLARRTDSALIPGQTGVATILTSVVGPHLPTTIPAPINSIVPVHPGGTSLIDRISQVVGLPNQIVLSILVDFMTRNPLEDYKFVIANLVGNVKASPQIIIFVINAFLTNGQSLGSPSGSFA